MTKKYLQTLIGRSIRSERTAKNMSIEEFAELLGITPGFIGLIERGQRSATALNLLKMAETLKISIDNLFMRAFECSKNGITEPGYEDHISEKEMMSFLNGLSDRELDFIILVIDELIKMNGERTV